MTFRNQRKVYRARRLLWVPETGQYIQPGEVVPLVELGRSAAVIQMHIADGNVIEETAHEAPQVAPPAMGADAVDEKENI